MHNRHYEVNKCNEKTKKKTKRKEKERKNAKMQKLLKSD